MSLGQLGIVADEVETVLKGFMGLNREEMPVSDARNVFGETLAICCTDPMTGFYRNGRCDTGAQDLGAHVVCAQMTAEFLAFSKAQGNDLSTPHQMSGFPGLQPGDRWCLCAMRWREAWNAGVAPPLVLAATHEAVLEYVPLEYLKKRALDLS